jgi:DNA-binding winged helix-turn-helix (wHTH) protein
MPPRKSEPAARELSFPALAHELPDVVRFGEFTLDTRRRALFRGGERLHLTEKPLATLILLAAHHGRVVTKRTIMDEVWRDTIVTEDNLVQAVGEIRRVLGDDKVDPRFVQTVPREGYRFLARVEDDTQSAAAEVSSPPVDVATPPVVVAAPPRVKWPLIAAVAVAVLATTVFIWRSSTSPRSTDSRLGLAVFPFRATTPEAASYAEALPDLLATILDGTPGVRVADPWALWRRLRPTATSLASAPDPPQGARLARAADADRFILGSVVANGNRLDVSVRVYRARGDEPRTIVESAPPDSLAALAQRLAIDVIGAVWERAAPPRVPRLEPQATKSVEALKAYLAAKEAHRRGLVDSANTAIDRALALDSSFALALVDAVLIKGWAQSLTGSAFRLLPLATLAAQHADSLGERSRLRIRSTLASVRTDGAEAAEAAGRLVALDSTDIDAWNRLAYAHLAYGWQYGKGERDARAALERVYRLDSTYVAALVRSAYLAVGSGDRSQMAKAESRLRYADTSAVVPHTTLVAIRAARATDKEFDAMLESLATSPLEGWVAALRMLRYAHPERAARLLERLRTTTGPGQAAFAVASSEARLYTARGLTNRLDSLIGAGVYAQIPFVSTQRDVVVVAASLAGFGD